MKFAQRFSPVKVLKPVVIELDDLGIGFGMGLLFNPEFIAMILERQRGVSARIGRKEA